MCAGEVKSVCAVLCRTAIMLCIASFHSQMNENHTLIACLQLRRDCLISAPA